MAAGGSPRASTVRTEACEVFISRDDSGGDGLTSNRFDGLRDLATCEREIWILSDARTERETAQQAVFKKRSQGSILQLLLQAMQFLQRGDGGQLVDL